MNDSAAECTEALDPRVQIELERLNTATDEINRLEVELDEARLAFRRLLAEGHLRIQQLTKKLGTSVHKARPYYEARFRSNITSQELQTATISYDKANSAHAAAREMVYLAEQGLARLAAGSDGGLTLDPAWQEMLNHATHRVNQAEADRAAATVIQRTKAAAHRASSALVNQLQNGLKRHIAKSRPYFEEKARINTALEAQKARIQTLEVQVSEAKQQYSSALRNLERISDEIHRHRSRKSSNRNDIERSTLTDTGSEGTTAGSEQLEEICAHNADANVREWLRRAADAQRPHCLDNADTWTEIDLDYSSPEEVSFEKCSLRPRSTPEKLSPPSPMESKVSASSPRRIIRTGDRSACIRAELEQGRRQSLDAILHDTGEKMKEMFQGLSLFGERRGSLSAPRTPRRASSPRAHRSPASASGVDDRHSDTDSSASVEMLTDEQIASLMLDAQLEAVCERLAGVASRQPRPNEPAYCPHFDDTLLDKQVMPTSDACSNVVENAQLDAEEINLDNEILVLLGDTPKDDTVLGKPVHKDIANRWKEILIKGLCSETKEKLLKDYLVPSNCEMLLAPKINPEVKAAVAENIYKRDIALTSKQNQIGTALAALSQALDSILAKDFSNQKLLKPISDACRILCDSHYSETKTRRHFVMSNINQSMKETMADTTRDQYLFGENIAENLKLAKSIKKSGTDLKATKSGPIFRNQKFNKNNFIKHNNSRDQSNWKTLQQKTTGTTYAGYKIAQNQPRFSTAAAATVSATRSGVQYRETAQRFPPVRYQQRQPPRRR